MFILGGIGKRIPGKNNCLAPIEAEWNMPATLSTDLRERVAAAIGGGTTARAAEKRFRKRVSQAIRIGQRDGAGIDQDGWADIVGDPGDHKRLLVRLASKPDLTMRARVAVTAVHCSVKKASQTFGTDCQAVAAGREGSSDPLARMSS